MNRKLLLTGTMLLLLATAASPALAAKATVDKTVDQLTLLEEGRGSPKLSHDMLHKRFESLMQQLVHSTKMDDNTVADQIVATQDILRERGIDVDLLALTEGMNHIESKARPAILSQVLSMYVVLRDGGNSHQEVIDGLSEILGDMQ